MRSKTNRFLGVLLALAMMLTSVLPSFAALAEGSATVELVSSATAALKPGDTFTVTPTIANNPGFAGVTWKLEYDNTALELTDISNEDGSGEITYLLESGTFVANKDYAEAGSGVNNIVFARASLLKKNGPMCVFTFKVRENAAAGDYTVNIAKDDADFKFVALDSVNVSVDFTPAIVTVGGTQSEYANAYLAYCKGTAGEYEFIPVGDTIYINNWANGTNFIQEYRIAVVNDGEIVADMPSEKWAVENKDNIFMNAYHNSSDPDGVFYINAHGKTEGATGSITATLPDGSTLKTNVVVTESASKIVISGAEGLAKSRYNKNLQAIKVVNGEIALNVKKTFEIPVTGGTVDGGKTEIPATEGESASFTPDQPEDGTVIDKVLVDGKEVSPNPDGSYTIPNPTEDTTVEIVTSKKTYTVTFTGSGAADADGANTAKHGEDYAFTITKDADYNYTVTATIGGKDVAVTGEYVISGEYVTGDITIVITKTEKSEEETMRDVTAYLNDSTDGTAMAKVAKNAQSYVFSNPYTQTAKAVRATVNGNEVTITANDDGTWTIPGTFAGNVEIYFAGVYSVTKPETITGEATAEYGKDYTFTVPAAYATGKPTVTIGGEDYALSDGTADENGNIVYTISGKDIKGDIAISLPDAAPQVDVNLYFKAEDANGEARNVYIVTATPSAPMAEDRVFAYGGEAMYWLEEYQAYAWLVSTGEALSVETATVQVTLIDGAKQTIDYSGDVNLSGTTDLNDAQLVYDLYNASYYDFSVVNMEKMLRADVSKDRKIDVSDVAAIVAIVRK